jgi:hypothetical protein
VKRGESDRLAVLALRAPPRLGVDRGGGHALVWEGAQEEVAAWADSLLEQPESEANGNPGGQKKGGEQRRNRRGRNGEDECG